MKAEKKLSEATLTTVYVDDGEYIGMFNYCRPQVTQVSVCV